MTQLPSPISQHRDAYPADEDYIGYAIKQIRHARLHTQQARTHQQCSQEEAKERLEAALASEQAIMREFEDYLSEALLWQEKKSGHARIAHEGGTLYLQESAPLVTLHDLPQLLEWVRHFQHELLALSLSLSQTIEPTDGAKAVTQRVEANLRIFYERTGLVPPGSQLEPSRPQIMLD